MNLFSSTSSFLPLPTPLSNRQPLSPIDNISSTIIDNDLQRVPPSFMLMQSSSTYGITYFHFFPLYSNLLHILGNASIVHSQPPIPQVVHSATRTNSMPSWRGYLPMKFEPMTIDQYQITSHFSQKVFLGGIPAELTEG